MNGKSFKPLSITYYTDTFASMDWSTIQSVGIANKINIHNILYYVNVPLAQA